MVDQKVLIGYTTQEWGRRADFHDYLNRMTKPENTILLPCHDRSPAYGRNMIIQASKELECSHLLLVDDDMAIPQDGLMRLLSHNKDIVTGLYLTGAYPHPPLIFDLVDESGAALNCYLEKDEPRLKKILNCGLGFVLFKMSVFDRLEKPYIRLGELDPEQWCDDIGFFNRVTAAGIDIYCDMECLVGHIKTMIVTPYRDVNGNWCTLYDTGGKRSVPIPQISKPEYQFKGA
jgi:hypothetical protein